MKSLITSLISILFILYGVTAYSQYSDIEKIGLNYTLQEEKAAYDFYTQMFSKYNFKVFENIMKAEKTHQEHVLKVMKNLNIENESYTETQGEFSIKEIQDLYNEMLKTGGYSLTDALLASARYEEKDISDLKKFYSEAQNETIRALYECLESASHNHLRAFVRNLKREGINYSPRILSTEEFNLIIKSKNTPGDCFQNF
ncbi:MAG: hypothetical protein HGGPFJEG_00402 [Ignavibacteria bacterium]|nr:hypothetical protein [Ignavibacteria bacterium]